MFEIVGINESHLTMALKVMAIQGGILLVIIALVWGTQKLYAMIDPVVFPNPAPVSYSQGMSEERKALDIIDAITYRLKYELGSFFGWTANDILFSKWVFDNRAYRQYGVYSATKVIFDFYAIELAKVGTSARENQNLYQARMNCFALSPARWGILFLPSAESSYKKGLRLIEKYKQELTTNNAVYNCRPDDVYSALQLILSDKLLGYAIGLLEDPQSSTFSGLDDKIYKAQGMVLVIRDFFNAIYVLYPDIAANGNEINYRDVMKHLTSVCTYNPLIITSAFNSGELVLSYLSFARNNIEDIKDSIRI